MSDRANVERVRSELAETLLNLLDRSSGGEQGAQEKLGIAPAEWAELHLGDISGISTERLIELLNALNYRVSVSVVPAPKASTDARPIWEIAAEIAASVPPEELDKLPPDLAANHDHYLYGAPKRY